MSLSTRVLATLREHCLVGAGDSIAVAISGGPDSVALAWILRDLERHDLIGASIAGLIHVNHGLRRAEAQRDEEFCRALATRLHLPIEIAHVDVAEVARRTGHSLEAAGRDVRYHFFRDAASRMGATLVATGHTVDDQAETVLLRLLRGAGARGMGGIRVRRGEIIRPLLHVRRAELRAYLAERGEPFCEDSSNQDRSFQRNRIRHELLPVMEGIAPGGLSALARFASISVADESYLQQVATEAAATLVSLRSSACGPREETVGATHASPLQGFGGELDIGGVQLNADGLVALPPAIGRRVVRLLMERAAPGHGFSSRHIEAVIGLASPGRLAGHLDLGHLQVERRGQCLWLGRQAGDPSAPFTHSLPLPGAVEIPEAGVTVTASYLVSDQEAGGRLALSSGREDVATVQGPLAPGPLTVRSRQSGDRLRPLGAPGHRKLHDILIDRKIPRAVRDRVPVVVDAAGHIVWVVGVTIAHEHRVTTPETGVVVLKCVGTQDT